MRVRKSCFGDAKFVAQVVYFSFEGHLKDGFLSVKMPSLTEQERISIVEEAISVSAGRESGAFAVDNFLLAVSFFFFFFFFFFFAFSLLFDSVLTCASLGKRARDPYWWFMCISRQRVSSDVGDFVQTNGYHFRTKTRQASSGKM